MFSFEIESILKENNYNITVDLYKQIVDTSPQITWSKYSPCEDKYYIYLSDISRELAFSVRQEK